MSKKQPEIYCQERCQKLSVLISWIFFVKWDMFFGTNSLIRSKTASVKNSRLNRMILEIRNKNSSGNFGE